eukprot:2294885-Rhodomonas_salina.1
MADEAAHKLLKLQVKEGQVSAPSMWQAPDRSGSRSLSTPISLSSVIRICYTTRQGQARPVSLSLHVGRCMRLLGSSRSKEGLISPDAITLLPNTHIHHEHLSPAYPTLTHITNTDLPHAFFSRLINIRDRLSHSCP